MSFKKSTLCVAYRHGDTQLFCRWLAQSARTHTHMHTHPHTSAHTLAHTCTHTHTHTHTHTFAHTHTTHAAHTLFSLQTTELLYGRRGFLFWLNKVAYSSVYVLIGAWILFRFVGPGIGLYTLEGNSPPPPV